jgi:hypothetical protein
MSVTGETYTCNNCGATYEKAWTDEESLAQTKVDFGVHVRADDEATLCDACYALMIEWWDSLSAEQRARIARNAGYGDTAESGP